MDELFEPAEQADSSSLLQIATITSVGSGTARIKFNGLGAIDKDYRVLKTGVSLAVNDRVVIAKISGTYVILGKLSY